MAVKTQEIFTAEEAAKVLNYKVAWVKRLCARFGVAKHGQAWKITVQDLAILRQYRRAPRAKKNRLSGLDCF